MANRRMFSLDIVDSDRFTDMPSGSQALYFHLGMRADDDGFVSSPKKIMRSLNFCDDEMRILISKGFVHVFESGICVVINWKMNNSIQKDRYKKTIHHEEFGQLSFDKNGSYVVENKECIQNVSTLDPKCIQNVSKMETQVSIGKVSIGKVRTSTAGKPADTEYSEQFEKFWEYYGKKGNKKKSYDMWKKLSESQKSEMRMNIKKYITNTPEIRYRKNAEVYLNPSNEHWNDKIVQSEQPKRAEVTKVPTGVFANA